MARLPIVDARHEVRRGAVPSCSYSRVVGPCVALFVCVRVAAVALSLRHRRDSTSDEGRRARTSDEHRRAAHVQRRLRELGHDGDGRVARLRREALLQGGVEAPAVLAAIDLAGRRVVVLRERLESLQQHFREAAPAAAVRAGLGDDDEGVAAAELGAGSHISVREGLAARSHT